MNALICFRCTPTPLLPPRYGGAKRVGSFFLLLGSVEGGNLKIPDGPQLYSFKLELFHPYKCPKIKGVTGIISPFSVEFFHPNPRN